VTVEELLQRAWIAVEQADLPESLQELALKEAIDYLRSGENHDPSPPRRQSASRTSPAKRSASHKGRNADEPPDELPDETTFFSQLASESGVDEKILRNVLQLKGGAVHVIPPTRKLGDSKAKQTRRVIALVAGAYAHGLDRSPVDAEVVRTEAKRKRCFDTANFAATLKKLKGFSQGSSRSEIMVGSKWLEEFSEAVQMATEGDADDT
jgi:hypothetical protein